ncbi:MAG: NADH-quinone oxidoreductase subunit J [Candidatus Omnitrophica bacterium]|nr:NADH-quinone oxidoreductase subunit J [Candidatus Omnitrophota bacterium]
MAATLFFWLCAFLAFFFGLGVIVARNPMHSALSLVMTFVASAGLFLLLHAEFLAWILIIVYSGAVMVLMIFVISLLNLQRDEPIEFTAARRWGVAFVVVFAAALLIYLFRDASVGFTYPPKPAISAEWGSAKAIATDLFTRYLLPFELASVLLTAAVIGAVVIARKPDPNEINGMESTGEEPSNQ